MLSFDVEEHILAAMAVRILKGERPEYIPIEEGASAYMFRLARYERWGLKESNLPPGSIVLNRQPLFFGRSHKWYILGGILFISGGDAADSRPAVAASETKKS